MIANDEDSVSLPSSFTSYGDIIASHRFSPPPPGSNQSLTSAGGNHLSSSGSSLRQPTLDDARERAIQTVCLRALRKAETVDGSRVGVIHTLFSEPDALTRIASTIKHQLLLSSYLFIISPKISTPGTPVLLMVCGSSKDFVSRAETLIGAKFVGRIEGRPLRQADGTRWLGSVHDLGSSFYDDEALWDVVRKAARAPMDLMAPPPGSLGVAQMLERARARLERVSAQTAYKELRDPTCQWPVVLVDIRTQEERQREGAIGGALVVERNVLEWRFDPRCTRRLPIADRYDLRVIVFCSDGTASSLAAASLLDLGLLNATDIIGGYKAWKAASLPFEVEVLAKGIPIEAFR